MQTFRTSTQLFFDDSLPATPASHHGASLSFGPSRFLVRSLLTLYGQTLFTLPLLFCKSGLARLELRQSNGVFRRPSLGSSKGFFGLGMSEAKRAFELARRERPSLDALTVTSLREIPHDPAPNRRQRINGQCLHRQTVHRLDLRDEDWSRRLIQPVRADEFAHERSGPTWRVRNDGIELA